MGPRRFPTAVGPTLVSMSDISGGAARATYRLHAALRARDVESTLIVRRRLTNDPSVRQYPEHGARWIRAVTTRASGLANQLQRTTNPVTHSSNPHPTRMNRRLRGGVANLHWVGSGMMSIEDLGCIPVPVVLTLHDMWAFCGAEHYAPDGPDARWADGYTRDNRPVGHGGLDIDRLTWNRKLRSWRPMPVVTPSRWLADCVRRSALMADWPVRVIPNPLDLDVFRPLPQYEARQVVDLPADVPVVLFGALGGDRDPRKGYDLLLSALHRLHPPEHTVAIVFGQDAPLTPPDVGIPLRWMGRINDESVLAALYSAADVMVVPSRQENLPQTATEAQACGLPVVAFDTSGLPDAVAHGETGYLARPFDPASLAAGIEWILEDAGRRRRLGVAAHERAKRLWGWDVVVPQYLEMYEEAARGNPTTAPRGS